MFCRRVLPVLRGDLFLFLCELALALAVPLARADTSASEPLAEVNGEVITADQVEKAGGAPLAKLQEQIYSLKRQKLETLIIERLLADEAAKRGISVPALLETEVTSKVAPVTEQEIESFYQENKSQLKGEEAKIREQIRAHLQNQKFAVQRAVFLQSLQANAKITVYLQPPAVVRVHVPIGHAPVRGEADAPVTIVEFSDFQCPFCSRAQVTLRQLLERYRGKVKVAYRDFPLDGAHPRARRAAEAARCAHDQGKFWEYHDLLFSHFPQANPEDLNEYAREAGLDITNFERCLSAGTHKATVQRDLEEGMRLGITGTPAFFINGRPLTGAQPIESFVQVIDEELMRVAEATPNK
jgi:protein-disulfide isomerase